MPDLSGDGVFWIFNVTTKKTDNDQYFQDLDGCAGNPILDAAGNPIVTVVEGLEADWIMEAPSYYGGFAADLANYSTATMYSAYASPTDSHVGLDPYQSGASLELRWSMVEIELSTVQAIDRRSMRFTWHAFY